MRNTFHLFFLFMLVLLAACAASPSPQRYVLESMPLATTPVDRQGAAIGIGTIVLPAYLDRLSIVHRNGNRLTLDDSQRWAEPLFDAVPRVLLANLSALLTDARMVQAPWGAQSRPDLKLVLRISRLEAVDNKTVELRASWSILDQQEKVLASNEAELSTPIVIDMTPADETSAIVTAHTKVLIALSRVIAKDITAAIKKKI
jgi:uncharacterized lipoprotein YmbA